MKLLRYGARNAAKTPCVLDDDNAPRDVSSIVADFRPETLSPELLERLDGVDLTDLPSVDRNGQRLAPPISQPRNIWCIGLNYSDHAAEAGQPVPDEPIVFNKGSATYCGAMDPILYSARMTRLDWEVELGVFISKPTLEVPEERAMEHVAGFTVVNDVSERAWQMERGGQWVKGKSYPNFCPTGPWLVTPEEVGDPQSLALWLDVNGERMQKGTTGKMIFPVSKIVSYLSEFCQLEAGDLICTGTPPGVGAGMKPARYLKVGDRIELGIEGLGAQLQHVVDASEAF